MTILLRTAKAIVAQLTCRDIRRASQDRRARKAASRSRSFETLQARELLTAATIVLDFNGANETDIENANFRLSGQISETELVSNFGQAFQDRTFGFLDFDANGQVDSADEQIAIDRILDRLNEDFAPFQIDIARNDSTVGSSGALTSIRNNGSNNDSLIFVSGGDATTGQLTNDANNDSLGEVSGSVGWAKLVNGRASSNVEKSDRFVNAIANNIAHHIGVSLGVPTETNSINIMSDQITTLTENLSFTNSNIEFLDKVVGLSDRPWAAVLQPGVLSIQGSADADVVNVTVANSSAWLVQIGDAQTYDIDSSASPDHNSLNQYSMAIQQISFRGLAGNDVFTVDSKIAVPIIAWGGAGNDHLEGGSGDDMLNGDEGDDYLNGHGGNDQMKGGAGVDEIYAGQGCSSAASLANLGDGDVISGLAKSAYGYNAGSWRVEKNPRMVADVNGDGTDDIVGFGNAVVYANVSTGSDFGSTFSAAAFGYNAGWRVESNPRMMADVNGDGMADVVGFSNSGVVVAISNGDSFAPAEVWIDGAYGRDRGQWTTTKHIRTMADVNGDGMDDIVGFGDQVVSVALSNGTGFEAPAAWNNNFAYAAGRGSWRIEKHERVMADVNGDGMADIVGFGGAATYVSLSNGAGFDELIIWEKDFGYNHGYRVEKHQREVRDINDDGMADVVAFFDDGVHVSLSTGDGFANAQVWSDEFGFDDGWQVDSDPYAYWRDDVHPRHLTDVDGDGLLDIIGFGQDGVYAALNNGDGFAASKKISNSFGSDGDGGWDNARYPRTVADLNGDHKADLVGFGWYGVSTVSTTCNNESIKGDFNADGVTDRIDIDLLSAAILDAVNDLQFDLTGDDIVNRDDHHHMIDSVLSTTAGDANLDGRFDSSDLVQIFQRGQYEDGIARNSGWGDGDWNADGEFDTADLVTAFQAGSYETAATPQPVSPTKGRTIALAAAIDSLFARDSTV